jgi:hypothetical protein
MGIERENLIPTIVLLVWFATMAMVFWRPM